MLSHCPRCVGWLSSESSASELQLLLYGQYPVALHCRLHCPCLCSLLGRVCSSHVFSGHHCQCRTVHGHWKLLRCHRMPLVTLLHGYFGVCPFWSFQSSSSDDLSKPATEQEFQIVAAFSWFHLLTCSCAKGIFPSSSLKG